MAGYIQQREEALKNARQWRFGRKSEAFQGEQRGLCDDDIEQQLVTLLPEPKAPKYLRPRQGQNPTRLSVALYRRTRCRAGDSAL
ncbi:transposase [Serratia symbiotica]|uniref:transposase n=1 Tax=Serratia symbiotica TaxID=138074 RepID=UPI003313EF3E